MKRVKRTLALFVASVMCLSVVGEIPAKAAAEKTTDISWFGGQNGNPWNGSDWTFLTGKDGNFSKMENYISNDSATASIKPGWAADADANTAYIGTWRQQATQEKWAVTAFDIAEDGNITGTSGQTLKTSGAGSGDVMVLLKNANGFYPVWPSKGKWIWQTVEDATGVNVNFTTGYKTGDTLYYIVKPSEGVDFTRITICPSLTFTGGTVTEYPAKFTAFGGDIEVWENHIGWYVAQATQPWPGSYFTFEYLDLSTNEFKKLETHVADANPAYWQDVTGTAMIKGWQQFASHDKYSAVTFTAGTNGVVALTNDTTVTSKIVDGELMILQRSGNSYTALMDWISIPTGQSVILPNVETYVEEGDIVYYLYRSKNRTVSVIEMTPSVKYMMGADDTRKQYPTKWSSLEEVLGPIVIENLNLKLTGATLQLENDITVNIKSKASIVGDYKNPYVIVEQELEDGEMKVTKVEGVLNDAETEYNFFYKGVEAKQVGDSFVATIYAYDEEENIVKGSAATAYSAKKYCTSMLAKTAEQIGVSEPKCERFKTLLVDLLNYATEAQKYFGYKEDMYVNADLSTELQAKASLDSVLTSLENITLANYETIENPTALFRGATLELQNKVYVKATVLYEGDMANVKAVFTVDGVAYEVTEYATSATNTYSFVCDEVTAFQLEEPIYIRIMDGDTVISNTARYSVSSYAAKYKTDATVGPVVRAMMKYGKAADAYITKGDQVDINRELFYGVCYCAYEAAVWYGRDVDAELQAMVSIGAKSTRVWMRSTHMMSNSKTFRASAVATMKSIISNAQARGIEVIGMNCNWFSGTDDDMAVPNRNIEDGSDYMKFLADYEETWYQMARKFPEIYTWEIGNEWNNDTFLHPLDYKEDGTTFTASEKAAIATDMLYYASKGIHRGNPRAKTVLGGLVDVYETGYGDAKTFLKMIYANIESEESPSKNPDEFFQIAAWHPYNHSGTPNAAWIQRQKDIYQVILDHEGHDKVVLFTEIGLSDYGDAKKDAEQKDDVIATLTMIRDELSFVQSVHWFRMFNEANAESWGGAFETGFGLFTEPDEDGNFELKAKGEAYLEMTGGK